MTVHPAQQRSWESLRPDDRLALKQAAANLAQEFSGIYGPETIERFLHSSFDQFAGRATVTKFLPLLAERFARQRLHALARVEGLHDDGKPVVLFLCTHNAGRSQMALGFFQALAGDNAVAWSGGSEPGLEVNPVAIQAMAERGIDIAHEFPKPWTDETVRAADVVITMGCSDACPIFPVKTNPFGLFSSFSWDNLVTAWTVGRFSDYLIAEPRPSPCSPSCRCGTTSSCRCCTYPRGATARWPPGSTCSPADAPPTSGLRTVQANQRTFWLNNRPYYLRSVLEQGYWPDTHLASPDGAALRREVELIKALGFNAARIHQKVEDPRFLYWADRLGLLIWGEMAATYEFSERATTRLISEWAAVVRRDKSHPCIVAWVPLNESWGVQHVATDPAQQHLVQALTSLTRALDPTRPVVSNDGWEHLDSDLWTIHDYTDSGEELAERYGSEERLIEVLNGVGAAGRVTALRPDLDRDQPFLLTEFGGVSLTDSSGEGSWGYSEASDASDLERRLEELFGGVNGTPLAGFCYTQLTDTGLETNGLLYSDRRPKTSIAAIRAIVLRTGPARDALPRPAQTEV